MELSLITAYHGTNKHSYARIQEIGFKIPTYSFLISPSRPGRHHQTRRQKVTIPGDLGAGLYAFEDSYKNAKRFAEKFIKSENTVVCELFLEVDSTNILDMNLSENLESINNIRESQHYNMLLNRYRSEFASERSRKSIDGLLIEYMLHINPNFKRDVYLVKMNTFTPFDNEITISQYPNGKEVCIKNKEIIKECSEKLSS